MLFLPDIRDDTTLLPNMITFECDFLDFRENDTLSHYAMSVCIRLLHYIEQDRTV